MDTVKENMHKTYINCMCLAILSFNSNDCVYQCHSHLTFQKFIKCCNTVESFAGEQNVLQCYALLTTYFSATHYFTYYVRTIRVLTHELSKMGRAHTDGENGEKVEQNKTVKTKLIFTRCDKVVPGLGTTNFLLLLLLLLLLPVS
jgi:hypothetical protein